MKVICLKPFKITVTGLEKAPRPEVGDEDEVTEMFEKGDKLYYMLKRFGRYYGFLSTHFGKLDSGVNEEVHKCKSNLHPVFEQALSPFIK